jgi:hypothetical protein
MRGGTAKGRRKKGRKRVFLAFGRISMGRYSVKNQVKNHDFFKNEFEYAVFGQIFSSAI